MTDVGPGSQLAQLPDQCSFNLGPQWVLFSLLQQLEQGVGTEFPSRYHPHAPVRCPVSCSQCWVWRRCWTPDLETVGLLPSPEGLLGH
jgi:hypothetical protein